MNGDVGKIKIHHCDYISNFVDLSTSQGLMHTILRNPTPVWAPFRNERQDKTEGFTMNVSFDLPQDIEEQVHREGADLNGEAREAYLVELYRQERITQHQLAEALGLSRLETEGVLKRHGVSSGVTAEEMRAQAAALREGLREARPE